MAMRHRVGRVRRERQLAGDQLEQQHARAVDITSLVAAAGLRLLRRQIGRGPDERPRATAAGLRVGQGPRQAEVGHLGQSGGCDEDILRFDVAVGEPGGVGGRQSSQDLVQQRQGIGRRHRAASIDDRAQRPAGHEFHHEVQQAAVLAFVENGDHVRVAELGGSLRLALEPAHEGRVLGQVGVQHLDRNRALQPLVLGVVDG